MSENYREECDGQWSSWSDWPVCPETCGDHTLTSTRTCTQGRLGADCEGESNRTKECSNQPCQGWDSIIIHQSILSYCFQTVDGKWGDWTGWGPCSKPKCGGKQTREARSCNNPAPAHGGAPCPSNNRQTQGVMLLRILSPIL